MALWEWNVLGGLGIALKNDISKTAEQRQREEREMREIDEWMENLDEEYRQAEKKQKKNKSGSLAKKNVMRERAGVPEIEAIFNKALVVQVSRQCTAQE